MKWEDALTLMRQTAPTATMNDATAFLAICQERGLSPFVEASPILTDYTSNRGEKVHSLAVKEAYTVQERWAQQCGGYIVSRTVVEEYEGGLRARVWIIANRDYAAVGKMASLIPSLDFREELARFEVCGESIVTAKEKQRRPPSTKTWEWVVTKRAREAALREKFGKEPSQSRQLYAAALTQAVRDDAIAALYGEPAPRHALTAAPAHDNGHDDPAVVEAEIVDAAIQDEAAEAMYPEAMEPTEAKPQRPYTPFVLRDLIALSVERRRKAGEALGPKLDNFKRAVVGNIESCFEQHADQARHLVVGYLLGGDDKASSKAWDDAETMALHRWMNATEQDGAWTVDPLACQEAHSVLTEAMACKGQMGLFEGDDPERPF